MIIYKWVCWALSSTLEIEDSFVTGRYVDIVVQWVAQSFMSSVDSY